MNLTTVLLPGGFKPPHAGHLGLANKFASRPEVGKVIVMVGPSERDGIGLQQSLRIWNLLPKNAKIQITSVNDESPMNAAFGYVFALPKNSTETLTLGASAKSPEDAKRNKIFAAAIERYKTKPTKDGSTAPKNVQIVDMTDDAPAIYVGRSDNKNGQSISASTLRQDLADKNYDNFKTNYPGVSDAIIKQIYKILTTNNPMKIKERVDNLPKEKKELLKNLVNEKVKSLKRELMNAKIKQKVREYVTGEDEPTPPAIDVSFTESRKNEKIKQLESKLDKLQNAIDKLKL